MLNLFDTLSRSKREFHPLQGDLVRIYTCGPSVYNFSHIGNFRTYLFEDVLVRYLIYKGFKVKRVMNITDIEDKAIDAARTAGLSLNDLQKEKINTFLTDFDSLGMVRPDVIAKASDHIPQFLDLIAKIDKNGFCKRESDGIYFDVRKFHDYGKLAHLKTLQYLGISKNDDYSKEGLWDFCLWKFWTPADGSAKWESQYGPGRPGWHIECSAMSIQYLGETFDIHCGGVDNIFPHHENEIAQSESATGKPFANFWLHCQHLTLDKRKMSKRTGNVLYVSDLIKSGIRAKCLRYYLLSESFTHHLGLTSGSLHQNVCVCGLTCRILSKLRLITNSGTSEKGTLISKRLISDFESAMDDNLNTKRAFKNIFSQLDHLKLSELSREDARIILAAIEKINSVLNVF